MNVIVAVTGSIAAYKAAVLVRELRRLNINVRVLMTAKAKDFITPLTMATLSCNAVAVENFSTENGSWNSHISLGIWADLMIVAPATANTIAKMASGIADNLVLDTCLACRAPIWVAPAMDEDMYKNKATQDNLRKLSENGIRIIEPESGFLASGLIGKGRMAEPEEISAKVAEFFGVSRDLEGKKVLVTLGATRENIDPVRFISNYSTGKMGTAIINRLLARGAEVYAVAAKIETTLPTSSSVHRYDVVSANDMLEVTSAVFPECDIAIFSAAVADYRPKISENEKIKRVAEEISLSLTANPDIALEMGKLKNDRQITIGFALETSADNNLAYKKLHKKNLDAIVFNSLSVAGAGFGCDTNKISILTGEGDVKDYPLKSKDEVAGYIVDFAIEKYRSKIN